MASFQKTISEILKGIKYMVDKAMSNTTKVYNGIIKSSDNNKWKVQFNGEEHSIEYYGNGQPTINKMVKVIIPDNNISLAFFI